MNQFPGLHLLPLQFLRQNISCFQLVGNISGYRSGWKLWIRKDMLQNIGIEKAWTCTHSRSGNEPNARNKNLFRIKRIECNGVNFGEVTKFKFRYSIVKFLLVWLNQLTGLHPPLLSSDLNSFFSFFLDSSIFFVLYAKAKSTLSFLLYHYHFCFDYYYIF